MFTGISYFIKFYCWIIIFLTLAASIVRESLTQRFTKFSSSYFFIFSFISLQEVKCSPKQNVFDSIIFFYITLKLLEKLLGSCHTGKLSPAKLADLVYWQFSTTKIFPIVIEFHFHGTCGASDKDSRFYLKSNLKKHSISKFLDFSIKKLVHRLVFPLTSTPVAYLNSKF